MHETPGPSDSGETLGSSGSDDPRRGWVPDDTTPHTYAVPSGGAPGPEPALPPVYGHPMPSPRRRSKAHHEASAGAGAGARPDGPWRRLRRAIGRIFPAFDVFDDQQ